MGFNCGIVGLPNVGKSTLFNALTATASAEAANYPFCTIEPNVGRVSVPDPRLYKLATLAQSSQTIPTQLEFKDIAGLVRGASKGEGLGNQFLGHIREVDAIVHVLRCFDDENITHVDDSVDPIRDFETIETELMIADLESLEKKQSNLIKKVRGQDKEAKEQLDLVERCLQELQNGSPIRYIDFSEEDRFKVKALNCLTSKPILFVCNVDEDSAATGNQYSKKVEEKALKEKAGFSIISASIESEVAQLETEEEKLEFLKDIGLEETGLSKVIREGYKLLDLLTFFTVGPKEARAWTVKKGSYAPQAAGVIHTDFQRGFIRAETTSYNDYIDYNGESQAKEAGKVRQEGKDYIVKDGDIFHFKFNV